MIRYLSAAAIVLVSATAMAQTGNVGINTGTPQTVLDVNGNTRIQKLPKKDSAMVYGGASATFTPANTVVADANGVLGIVPGTPSNFWSLTGNAETAPGTNFLGTTDAHPLMFKVHNTQSGFASELVADYKGGNVTFGFNALPNVLKLENASSASRQFRQNIAIGWNSMANVDPTVSMIQNVAIGDRTLMNLTSGGTNIAIGNKAMMSAKGASSSIAMGVNSLMSLDTDAAWGNIALGFQVGQQMTSGRSNIFLKNSTANGLAGDNFKSGDYNIFLGQDAGSGVINGSRNIVIGSGVNMADGSNQLNISNAVYGTGIFTANPKIGLGFGIPSPNSTLQVNGSVSANIRTLSGGSITDTDYTVLATGEVSLPAADSGNKGRIYNIVNDSAAGITVSGNFRQNGTDTASITVSSAVTVQSTGSRWVVISRN